MIETDREVDECLEEEPPRPNLFRPSLFQHFVALENSQLLKSQIPLCNSSSISDSRQALRSRSSR